MLKFEITEPFEESFALARMGESKHLAWEMDGTNPPPQLGIGIEPITQ
jgi:hypothetical protein